MVTVYVTLIINNRKTIEQVPSKIREEVIAELASMGLGQDGQPLE